MVTQAPPADPAAQLAPALETPLAPPVDAPFQAAPPTGETDQAAPAQAAAPAPAAPQAPAAPAPAALSPEQYWQLQSAGQTIRSRYDQTKADIDARHAQHMQELQENDGVAPERAKALADRAFAKEREQADQALGSAQKALAIELMSRQYHISPQELVAFNDPQAMEAHAAIVQSRNALQAENQRLKAQLAKVSQGLTPPTSYQGGQQPGSNGGLNEKQLEKQVASGEVQMTPEIRKRLEAYWNS